MFLQGMSRLRLGVFCGSSRGNKPIFETHARELGVEMARRDIILVYGGGNIGLMGVVADAVLEGGGEVIGVIPKFLEARELAHRGATKLHLVDTMHERKALMADLSDGFIALPGGFGTFDELCEILTWAQLQLHAKPCGVLNIHGYFDAWFAQVATAQSAGFIRPEHTALMLQETRAQSLLDRIIQRAAHPISIPLKDEVR